MPDSQSQELAQFSNSSTCTVYMEDSVFMFEKEHEMVRGADLIAEHFKMLRLKMH
jgi:hypothetical protein